MATSARIGIQSIGVHIPTGGIDLLAPEWLERLGTEPQFVEAKTGMRRVARKAEGQDASDLAIPAVETALRDAGKTPGDVDYLVVVTQNPDGFGLPHTAAVLHGKLGLAPACPTFDISLGCSGWVHGLSILRASMEAEGRQLGLLVTADPYSRVVDDNDKNTSLLFGDAAAATILSDTPVWSIGEFDLGTRPASAAALHVDEERKLQMNGREVFTFAATTVPGSIQRVLEAEDLDAADIDRFILHQGSKYIVETLGNRIQAPDKTPFFAAEYGNSVSSSIPIGMTTHVEPGDDKVVVSGFGVGLTWATTLLTRIQ